MYKSPPREILTFAKKIMKNLGITTNLLSAFKEYRATRKAHIMARRNKTEDRRTVRL